MRTVRLAILFCFFFAAAINAVAADKYDYCYTEAIRQKDMGDDITAFNLLRRSIEINPEAGEAYAALAEYYIKNGKDSLALLYQKRAAGLQPENTEFAEALARTYIYRDSIAKAAEVYEGIVKQSPERTDYLSILLRIYQEKREYEKMLSVLDRLEVQEGQSESLTLSKVRVYGSMGKADEAYNELKKLIEARPADLNLRVMLGNWLYGNGRKEEAAETFKAVLKEEPENAEGQMSLMDYCRQEGKGEAADSILYRILINPHTKGEARLAAVKAWINDPVHGADSARVMQMFGRVLSLPKKDADVAVMRASYLQMMKAPTETVLKALRDVLSISPDNLWARLNLLQEMWKDTIDLNVVEECRRAIEYIPDDPGLYYYLAIAQHVTKNDTEAILTLRRGIDQIGKDTKAELSSDLYSLLGDLLQKNGDEKEAFAAYEKSLEYTPTRSMTLNNYAYYLSLRKENLKKAEQMSYRAITAEANNATYLDTYAWILYQEKRYSEARIYIDQALKCNEDTTSESSVGDIFDHAGDIYFRLGFTDKAKEYWQKALPLGVENEAVLKKKIKRGKL